MLLALLSWMLFSCSQELEIDPIEYNNNKAISEEILTVKATIVEVDDTKTAVQSDGTSIFWTPGDAINLFYGTASAGRFATALTSPALSTEFSGTLSVATGTSTESGVTTQSFWGVYPYNPGNTCTGDGVTLTIPTNQSGIAGSFADKLNPSIATSPGLSLAFYNVGSWFIFSVTQKDVVSATLSGFNDEDLAGKVKVTIDPLTQKPSAQVLDGVKSITMIPEGGEFEVGEQYYMVVIPQTMENGFQLTLKKNDGSTATWKIENSVTFTRSQYLRKLNADNGKTYTVDVIPNNEIWYTSPNGTVIDPYFACTSLTNNLVSNTITDGIGKMVFNSDISILPSQAFYRTNYKTIKLPASVTTIQDKVFYECYNLEYVEMPSVIYIDDYNFHSCTNLKELTLPSSLTSIGVNGFDNCNKLEEVTINTSSSFGTRGLAYVFNGAPIKTFRGPYATGDGRYVIINDKLVMAAGKSLVDAIIPSGITEIQPYVFYGYQGLQHVVIPNSVSTIGGYSFYNCSFLEDVQIESTTPASFNYGNEAFVGTNDCPILVPSGCVDDYKTSWAKYSTRIGHRIEDIPVNLCKDGRANCYVVEGSGDYQFVANKQGNSNTDVTPGTPASVEVLWESVLTPPSSYYDYGYSHDSGTLISSIRLENDHIVFTATGNEGNALVAVKNSSGTILWSWHLWFTSVPIEEISNPTGTAVLMDRNLGAVKNDYVQDGYYKRTVPTYGLLYQWGRKDPFVGGDASLWSYVISTEEGISTAVQNPTTIYDKINGVGWYSSKTSEDPCPPGWRIPDVNSWPIMKTGTDRYTYADSKSNCYWDWDYDLIGWGLYTNSNWYPAAGYISKYGSVYAYDQAWTPSGYTYGYYWAALEEGNTTPYLFFQFEIDEEDNLYYIQKNNNDYWRNMAMSVRCQKE